MNHTADRTPMTTASVRLDGIPCGRLSADASGALEFSYDADWRARDLAYPVSPVMPMRDAPYGHLETSAFFANLLPDSSWTQGALATRLGTRRHTLDLLSALGADCAGAVTVVPEDTPVVADADRGPSYETLTARELAERIAALPAAPLFASTPDEARATLAGTRPKAAVVATGGQVAIAARGTPSTHILKAEVGELPGLVQVEHFCLRLAAALGMDAATSSVGMAEDLPYLLVGRFDRGVMDAGGRHHLGRRHQFDFCQAFGFLPAGKFEKDGGPGWRHCFSLVGLATDPARDRAELLSRAVFHFLSGNPDAHAKNHAMVMGPDGIALSRLYDVNNAGAFAARFKSRRERVAMAIGGEHDPGAVTEAHWTAFAAETGQEAEAVLSRLRWMAAAMPDEASTVRDSLRGTVADSDMLDTALDDIAARCARFAGPGPGAAP